MVHLPRLDGLLKPLPKVVTPMSLEFRKETLYRLLTDRFWMALTSKRLLNVLIWTMARSLLHCDGMARVA